MQVVNRYPVKMHAKDFFETRFDYKILRRQPSHLPYPEPHVYVGLASVVGTVHGFYQECKYAMCCRSEVS
jgi:hypothetical protein